MDSGPLAKCVVSRSWPIRVLFWLKGSNTLSVRLPTSPSSIASPGPHSHASRHHHFFFLWSSQVLALTNPRRIFVRCYAIALNKRAEVFIGREGARFLRIVLFVHRRNKVCEQKVCRKVELKIRICHLNTLDGQLGSHHRPSKRRVPRWRGRPHYPLPVFPCAASFVAAQGTKLHRWDGFAVGGGKDVFRFRILWLWDAFLGHFSGRDAS